MGNKQQQAKQRDSNLSMVSYGRSVSTAPTNESGMLRFTTDGSMSSSMFGGVETYFNRLPNPVVDGICKFLTINDLTNLYCTSKFVYERFYTSLPYSIKCGDLLYKLYEDRRGIVKFATETKHASWPQVLEVFIHNKNQMKNLPQNLKESLQQAYQQHIIYPPLLMDEVTKEGLNSDFQKQIMQKLQSCQECQSITEIQILNQTRAFFKKSQNSRQQMITKMLEIRTLREFQVDQKLPQLFNIIILITSTIKSLLQIVALTLECAGTTNDSIGQLDFYLYNFQMYLIWMQQIDQHVTPYLHLFDIILKEQIPSYHFPPLNIQWIMMKMWNQYIYSKCKHALRSIFLQQLYAVRISPTLKYEQYLLKDYVKSLIDLSTTQSNVRMAGHSKFKYMKDLENLFIILIEQTGNLYQEHNINFSKDINVLGYIFQKHILENKLIPHLLEQKYAKIQAHIEQIKQSPEFSRRIQKYNDENQFITQQTDYSFQLLNINKVFYKIKSIINCEPLLSQTIRLTINYQKNTYDKLSTYIKDYHAELYEEISKLADLDVVSTESVQIRDAMILYRTQSETYEEHLISYDELIDIETLKQLIKQKSASNSKKNSLLLKKTKSEPPKLHQQPDINNFLPITIVTGLNLAQSLTEQFISQQ
ncbi:unnamed protein product [Paramecium primaurelia]|uniref:Uncharacterized protein n=1 Tax=Paramecium primaurelia TaxID=5886 RepID=A0A8S1MII3_PARPR|nr:unnamed protein product [Paramecium primaurelia]